MHVDAGKLSKRIQFLRRTTKKDADGYDVPGEPEPVRETWAQYSQTSGTELVRAGAEFGEAKVRFLTRYYADIQDRRLTIRYDGRDYDILYLNAYGDEKTYTEYWCERHTQEGKV
jgi:SPP1 family predicted phage head-tail adaptor